MQFTLKVLTIVYVSLFVIEQIEAYDVPEVTVEALKPQGLHVSLPDDSSGIKFIEFHANINEDIKEKEPGHIFNRVTVATKGDWQFIDDSVALKKGDVLNYWILVWNDEESNTKYGLTYKVEDLVARN